MFEENKNMSDLNFLPEKEKEAKEKKQNRSQARVVEFHTPQPEPRDLKPHHPESIFKKLFSRLVTGLFKLKKQSSVSSQTRLDLTPAASRPETPVKLKSDKQLLLEPLISDDQAVNKPIAPPGEPTLPAAKPSPTNDLADLSTGLAAVDVNLMPWQDPSRQRQRHWRLALLTMSLLTVIAWGTTWRIVNSQKAADLTRLKDSLQLVDGQLADINAELLSQGSSVAVRQNEFIDLYYQLPRWSNFISWLESRTELNVSYRSLTVKQETVELEASATNYLTAARQWLAYETATSWVESVQVSEFNRAPGTTEERPAGVEFKLTMKLRPEAVRSLPSR